MGLYRVCPAHQDRKDDFPLHRKDSLKIDEHALLRALLPSISSKSDFCSVSEILQLFPMKTFPLFPGLCHQASHNFPALLLLTTRLPLIHRYLQREYSRF